jgi:hypothetical protein
VEAQLHACLSAALDGGGRPSSRSGRLNPYERSPGTHCSALPAPRPRQVLLPCLVFGVITLSDRCSEKTVTSE